MLGLVISACGTMLLVGFMLGYLVAPHPRGFGWFLQEGMYIFLEGMACIGIRGYKEAMVPTRAWFCFVPSIVTSFCNASVGALSFEGLDPARGFGGINEAWAGGFIWVLAMGMVFVEADGCLFWAVLGVRILASQSPRGAAGR